jgi:hypothetical protein
MNNSTSKKRPLSPKSMYISTPKQQRTHIQLPQEIFTHIFEFFSFSFLIRTVSAVCKEWYSIVFNSPNLWHTLELNIDGKNKVAFESFKKFCKNHTKQLSAVKRLIHNTKKLTTMSRMIKISRNNEKKILESGSINEIL